MIWATIDADPDNEIMDCWKLVLNADAITSVKEAVDELQPEIVNGC